MQIVSQTKTKRYSFLHYYRFEEEKEALMAKLLGANNKFLSERERQALLARLKREQLKARLEEKFGSAALVLGLAERQRKDAEERWVTVFILGE